MKYISALFICVLIALHSVCAAQSEPPAPSAGDTATQPEANTRQTEEKTQPDNPSPKDNPAIVEISKAPVIQIEATDKTEKRNRYSSAEWWMVYVTGLLSIITFGLAVYTARLFFITARGNELNQKAFISSQRPWVVVQKIIPRSHVDLNKGLSFSFIVKNVGRSPAMNVVVSATVHLPHRGDAHEVHRKMREGNAKTRPALIANDVSIGHLIIPGEERGFPPVRIGIDYADFTKAAAGTPNGEIIILILGQVTYGFGIEGSQHESGFIFSVCKRGGAWVTLSEGIIPIDEVEIEPFGAGFYAT